MKMEIVGVKKPIIIHSFSTECSKWFKQNHRKTRGVTLVIQEFDGKYLTIYCSQCSSKDSFCRRTGVETAYNNPPHVIPLENLHVFVDELCKSSVSFVNSVAILNKILFGKWRAF